MKSNKLAKRQRGQAMVEFSLLAPLFFFIIFAIVNGSFLLFSYDTAAHSASNGMLTLANEGRQSTADTDAVARVSAGGVGLSSLAKVNEIDIFKVNQDPTTGALTADVNGCNGSPCINRYKLDGTPIGTIVWPPNSRSVTSNSSSFIGITVDFNYNHFAWNKFTTHIQVTKYIRLEPQSS